jgi:hypothetical protein
MKIGFICFGFAFTLIQSLLGQTMHKDSCSNAIAMLDTWPSCRFINLEGQNAFPGIFYYCNGFSEGLASAKIQKSDNFKFGYFDTKGVWVTKQIFDRVTPFHEGLAAVKISDKWGYINKKGEIVIPAKFDLACRFSEGLAIVRIGSFGTGKFGIIDKQGKWIVEPRFSSNAFPYETDLFELMFFVDGKCPMGDGKKWGFINAVGDFVIQPKFDALKGFSEGLAAVDIVDGTSEKVGFIDVNGKMVIEPRFTYSGLFWTYKFHEGVAVIAQGNLYGLINKEGKEIIKADYTDLYGCHEGLIPFQKRFDGFGYMDKNGNIVLKPIYHSAGNFSLGLACVSVKNENSGGNADFAFKSFYINRKGEMYKDMYSITSGYSPFFCPDK